MVLALCIIIPASIIPFSAHNKDDTTALPIIMYHHISTSPKCWSDYTISPSTFEGDLEYLRLQGYTTISLKQLISYTRGECELPKKPVMITFDDGYASFATYALPLLEEYNMRAVVAIIGCAADTFTETEDHNINYSYFSWPELEKLNNSPCVELSVHTYNMHSLDTRQGCKKMKCEDLAAYTLALNRDLEKIESRFTTYIGEKPVAFAYPYGFCCKEARNILTQRDYTLLFTCEECVNKLTGAPGDLLHLGRFNRPSSINREQFFKKLIS